MGKQKWLWMLGIILFLLTGCQESNQAAQPPDENDSELNADVVNVHGGITGLDKMENYFQQVEKEKKGDLRVVSYTIEGDPILTDLAYDGKHINVTFDYTRDQYGNGEVKSFQCGKLKREENPTNLSYYLTGCEGVKGETWGVLETSYDVKRQDAFEVELRYGAKEGEKQTIQLNDEDKQEVYKQLVLANYLDSKPTSDECLKGKKADNYLMKVKINGGNRTLNWNACGSHESSKPFTDIAEYIIHASKHPTKTSENVVYGYILEVEENQILIGEDLTAADLVSLEKVEGEELSNYDITFLYVETGDAQEFSEGDKIVMKVDEVLEEGSPGRVKASDIKKITE
ncbi:DUF4362 domain-containing protein [Rossellomorea sp. SC111]|uniref:DUF4362 domain-containing protein n=1 Tax=Rossellomorea sp. SC111 TaxID=2968985 RepID=UPI00215AEE48|nr:DUF4362 domain-containing protein [Rossellomorea sp. SC111]MCR8851041.1 DUF4362 domain-containing protein [Rossellomorea sp. SC111]